jgi:hypothetical protein
MSEQHRLAAIQKLAPAYFKLLRAIDWRDPVLVCGLREGLNKFLSNAHLGAFRGANKYHTTHFISAAALGQLERRQHGKLVWEHLVPKRRYIQEPCEGAASAGTLTIEFIEDHLTRYWFIATVSGGEDRLLMRTRMPKTWDGADVRARYAVGGVELIENPFFEKLAREVLDTNS